MQRGEIDTRRCLYQFPHLQQEHRYQGKKPCYRSILAYIISYRQHNGFHEQCVEQIFADIWQNLKPEKLMVYATYTRRGGLDINPCRVSDESWMPSPIRLARQ